MGPVARMMMSVASHAITSYVQFRALAEVLIARGVITREELEAQFANMGEGALEATVDEWFEPDVAYHLKMAIKSAQAADERSVSVTPADPNDLARARAVQNGE
jgi:hypothetical protein